MRITILCVGKIKEKFYREAIEEYRKRLGRYCRPEIIEVADEKTPDGAGELLKEQIREREGRRLLDKLPADALVCTLEIEGKRYSSETFADMIRQAGIGGRSHIAFIIGGSLGLGQEVRKKSHKSISFSDMTFPHQLMRVILTEQIYRACRIIQGEPYHK